MTALSHKWMIVLWNIACINAFPTTVAPETHFITLSEKTDSPFSNSVVRGVVGGLATVLIGVIVIM